MVYLTTAEYAEIANNPNRTVQQKCKNGMLNAIKQRDSRNRPMYKIPITELKPEQQIRYYRNKSLPLPEELIPARTKQVVHKELEYEELSDRQREQVSIWIHIIEDWQSYMDTYDGGKVEAMRMFVEINKNKYPVKLSSDILYRKFKTYKLGNVADLADGRGLKRKGLSCINENVWQVFLYYYLDESQKPIKECYDLAEAYVLQECPQLYPLPHYTTFYRHIGSDIPRPVEVLGREGEKAYRDKCGLYIRREYEEMESNDYWIADNHTFDVMVADKNKKPKRMYLTAFMDARSGIFTGVYITDSPNSQATIYALKRGIQKYGIPKNIYVDNGREFLTHDVGGLGHRKKKSQIDRIEPPPIFARLGINMVNALVRNARAKTIERRFLDVKNRLSRLFDSFTGGNVIEKPERLKEVLKGDIIDEVAFTSIVEDILNYHFNEQAYGGSVKSDIGKPRNQVYVEHLKNKRIASEDDLYLMLLRTTRPQKVSRRGVHITICGRRIDYYNDDLKLHWQGKDVYVRYDPENLREVRVYDTDDRFIMAVMCDDKTISEYGASKDTISEAMREVRRHERIVKDELASKRIVALGAKNALDVVLTEVEINKHKPMVNTNDAVVQIQRADEQPYTMDVAVGDNTTIDFGLMIQSAEARNRKDEY